ncbi:MAG: bifunctional DNA-formamidopyrimidine glycosylase/DNA-(apurinic or apyrimidinic site) lyase [Spongiibacteraceae bacterium]|jgi:formamidopyrimidine-DNA glycosylase|nr:bifunctional DNA-formamidopyrimidine glycosylase/DNA-(apurinic or apyrimidinic site) lyase [Spongiibacteraceae bacterium]
MPELPEVETTRRGIEPHLAGRRIAAVAVRQPKLRWPVPADLAEQLVGQRIGAVLRRAKYLLIPFPAGTLLMHLGMSGSLRIIQGDEPPGYHDHVDLVLDDGRALRLHDPRRFGAVLWVNGDVTVHPLLAGLGPEPLSDAFDGDYLYARSRRRSAPVKSFLMDGRVVVGVGNIYANEALFAAGIRPDRAAGRISLARYRRLADEVKRVLAHSIEQGGTTLRDFVGGDGKPGYFKQELLVYGRGGESCKLCRELLIETRLGQRSTVFCRRCQR